MDTILGRPGSLVAPVDELRDQLNRLRAVAPGAPDAGRFNGAEMMLFVNDITPTKDTVLADLTPATFTGYAQSAAIAWGAAFEADDGSAMIVGPGCQFLAGAVTGPFETVYGYAVVDAAGTDILFAERIAAPVEVNHEGQAIVIIPRYSVPR